MSNWDRMDHKSYQDSEVINELEQLMIKSAKSLANKVTKEAQQMSEVSKKLTEINKGVETTSKNMGNFIEQTKNLADDEGEEIVEEENFEPTPEEYAAAKSSLLDELEILAKQAADNKNIKLAYKIERTIDSILYEE